VIFMQVGRVATRKNLGSYPYTHYEPTYLAGVIAGRLTKSNKLGYVGMIPVPVLMQSINAFALGVHSVNPAAKIKVVWTNTWYDAIIDTEAANSLIETGVDILALPQNGNSPVFGVAESKKIKVIGCYTKIGDQAPKQWLTGVCFNWGPFYTKIAKSVIDHTWENKVYLCDMKNGFIDLAPFGPLVPDSIRKEISVLKEKIKTGKLVVFEGPVKDSQGKLRLQAGQKPDIRWIANMNFFVQGIEGSLPK
jgi:basic membrane protein A